MSDSVVYNIPIEMIDSHQGRNLVVRGPDPSLMVQRLAGHDLERIAYLQILGTGGELDDLMRWERPIPVDLVVRDPGADLPRLYQYSPLTAGRPVRVTVPVVRGFSKVVKLALSLDFAVKLEVAQPGPALVEELLDVVDLYLHQTTVTRPVEFIHSMFLSFVHGEPVRLWTVQEEDPSVTRYITDRGTETISARFAGVQPDPPPISFLEKFIDGLLEKGGECTECLFFEGCLGYFKWPDRTYPCDGMKTVLQKLREAAEELKRDLASIPSPGGEERP